MGSHGKIDSLTLVRGIAASLVLVVHAFAFLTPMRTGNLNSELGSIGVDIFFILSGFIMAFAHWDDFGKGWNGSMTFIKKRIIRIYPLYFSITLALAASLYFLPQLFHTFKYDNIFLLKSLFFIPSRIEYTTPHMTTPMLGVAWTLSYEIIFYLIFSICLLFKRRTGIYIAIASLILWAAAGVSLNPENYISIFFLSSLPLEFAFGIATYVILKKNKYILKKSPTITITTLATAIILLLLGLTQHPLSTRSVTDNYRVLYFGVPAALIFFGMLHIPQTTGKTRTIANLIGNASYSTYLTHYLILGIIKAIATRIGIIESTNTYILVIISCFICTTFGIVIHKTVEVPATRFMRNIWLSRRSIATPANAS